MSRRFAIVKPEDLWTGPKTRELRKHPSDVRELLAYVLTGPSSDRWGIWHLELDTIALQTGRKADALVKSFAALAGYDLAFYDVNSQFVFVPDMPESQFARWPLLPNDNNVRHAKRWYRALPRNPYLGRWFDRHVDDLFLDRDPEPCDRREWVPRPGEPVAGPPVEEVAPTSEDLLGTRNLPAKRDRRKDGSMMPSDIDLAFNKIMDIYPKGDASDRARKVFQKMKPTPELVQTIFAALQWQVRQPDWIKEAGSFAPRFDRYLEGKRWLDRPRKIPSVNASTAAALSAGQDFLEDSDEWKPPQPSESGLRRR